MGKVENIKKNSWVFNVHSVLSQKLFFFNLGHELEEVVRVQSIPEARDDQNIPYLSLLDDSVLPNSAA